MSTNAKEGATVCLTDRTPDVSSPGVSTSSAKVCGRTVAIMTIDGLAISISGRRLRTAKVRDEPYKCLCDSEGFVAKLRREKHRPDLFSFMQPVVDQQPHHPFHYEFEELAVLRITTYKDWWKNGIRTHTRNHIKKALKRGVEVRQIPFDDNLVRAVKTIFDECPLRQGKPFWHYRKDHETIRAELATFLDQSYFLGAFWEGKMIGYIKMTSANGAASMMQIISMIAHRDKAPSNALLTKAIELCAEKGISHLHYGLWCSGGFGTFKENHGFQPYQVPRYFVPLTAKGQLTLRLGLHRRLVDRLPPKWRDPLVEWRNAWNSFRYKQRTRDRAVD
jgi:hypothetical protein